jgi:hypothetical protein
MSVPCAGALPMTRRWLCGVLCLLALAACGRAPNPDELRVEAWKRDFVFCDRYASKSSSARQLLDYKFESPQEYLAKSADERVRESQRALDNLSTDMSQSLRVWTADRTRCLRGQGWTAESISELSQRKDLKYRPTDNASAWPADNESTWPTTTLVYSLLAAVIATAFAYNAGYRRGQLYSRHPTVEEQNTILMELVLPRWRRVAGWASILVGSVSVYVFLYLASKYGGSALAFLLAFVASLAGLMGGYLLAELFWKPYREAQDQRRKKRAQGLPDTVDPPGPKGK